jgi:HNH endonuclease
VTVSRMAWAMNQAVGHPVAKSVLVFLGDADSEGHGPTPPDLIAHLELRCEVTAAQVGWALDYLQESGFIDVRWYSDETCDFRVGATLPPIPAPPPGRKPLSPAVRATVLARDGHSCVVCFAGDDLHIDHIVPVVAGGTDDPANLQVLCRTHNLRKGTRSNDEFMAEVTP